MGYGLPLVLTTTPLVVTLTATGAVWVPSVKVIVQLPAATGVTVAVNGDADWVGLTVATPEQVFVSLSVPVKPVSDTVTVCAALAPVDVNVSVAVLGTGPVATLTVKVAERFVVTVSVVEPTATGVIVTEPEVSVALDAAASRRREVSPAGTLTVATLASAIVNV